MAISLSCLALLLPLHVALSFQQPQPVRSRHRGALTAVSSSSASSTNNSNDNDTPVTLPAFASAADYLAYMATVATPLPQGFAIGTADGTFTSVEAPNLGALPIRATVIHLPDGPTEAWAAVFTQNQVRCCCCYVSIVHCTMMMPSMRLLTLLVLLSIHL